MWELRRETITSLTFPLSILNDFNFTRFGQKKIEESANLLAEFVGDTANCKNIMKILKPKTGVRIFTTSLRSTITVFIKMEKKQTNKTKQR